MPMIRRRPLARAAMVGGAAYVGSRAGANNANNNAAAAQQEADQSQQIAELQAQQAAQQAPPAYAPPPPAYAPPAPAAPAPAAGVDIVAELTKLKELSDVGAITPDEFAAAKAKLLA
jgi:hemolysin activation/secretion protein